MVIRMMWISRELILLAFSSHQGAAIAMFAIPTFRTTPALAMFIIARCARMHQVLDPSKGRLPIVEHAHLYRSRFFRPQCVAPLTVGPHTLLTLAQPCYFHSSENLLSCPLHLTWPWRLLHRPTGSITSKADQSRTMAISIGETTPLI